MFAYHLRLALLSLKRNPVITALVIGAIALGVGICITTLTVYRLMSGNPMESRNDVLYAVTLDSWDPNDPWDDDNPDLPPMEVTYRDAKAMLESDIPTRRVAMHRTSFVVDPQGGQQAAPFLEDARVNTAEFFTMFDLPFLYGSAWDREADDQAQLVAVISKEVNEKVFGGEDSVGRSIRMDGRDFKVVGVLDEWNMAPKVYDLNNGALSEIEQIFVPFSLSEALQLVSAGNTNCWRNQPISSYREFLDSDCVWIQFWAELPTPDKVDAFQTFIDSYVQEQKRLGRFERPLNNKLRQPDEWLRINEVVRDDNRVLVGLSFMFLAVCLLNMIGLLLAKFIGAAPLVGLRRALGASRLTIFRQHLVEVSVIGFTGGLLGIGIAALGLIGVRNMYENYDDLTKLDLTMALTALLIAVVSGVLAGLYPTWRVCKLQPANYLKTQ